MHNLGGNRTAASRWWGVREERQRARSRQAHRLLCPLHPGGARAVHSGVSRGRARAASINYLDWNNPSFREQECVEVANKHGLPIVAMEPVKGGLLADPPVPVREILDEAMPGSSYAVDALRFAANQDVFTVLSGMNTIAQVEDNARAFADFKPLSPVECAAIERGRKQRWQKADRPMHWMRLLC